MPAAAPPFCCPKRHAAGLRLFAANSTAGEAGVPLPASPADEFPAEKLNPEGVAEGSKTKVKNPPQKPGRWGG